MTESTKNLGFKLVEDIKETDYAAMAKLWDDSFLEDANTNIKKLQETKKEGGEEKGPDDSLIREWVASDECHMLKAVSTSTGEILGWVGWGHRGYVYRKPQPEMTSGGIIGDGVDEQTLSPVERLAKLQSSHFRAFMTDIMPEGTKCWYIMTLVVGPQFQRQGLGRAMIEWGRDRAEKDGVFAWVHSSDMAWQAYKACGFEIVRVLELHLDDYAAGDALGKGPELDGKWGTYTFRYMVYKPERAIGLVKTI